ncbi:MAG: hypothetical protein JWO69_827, partial [Thermoleophilia bacterium]|nr:hypothetical protein [Thermoleophilia bacterium]
SQELIELATRTLDTARDHARALDLMAGAVAQDARTTGTVDTARLEQVERMTETLADWSLKLRAIVEGRGEDDATVVGRLRRAVEAGSTAGRLEALVARL